MKHKTLFMVFIVTLCARGLVMAQAVVNTDVTRLVQNLTAPPANLQEAYARVYPGQATYPETRAFYESSFLMLQKPYDEGQQLMKAFYLKHPTGMAPATSVAPAGHVSAQQQNAMDAATSELAQKMMSDPAFAQQFARMSEAEQHAYITKALSDKGIKPVAGKPNVPQKPIPGTDVNWMQFCQDYAAQATQWDRWSRQASLQQKYDREHEVINQWMEAEIKKLPMISFGEYGHDHDPEKVKAIRKSGMEKHRQTADAMMKELNGLFKQLREESIQQFRPLQQALQQVHYGAGYDFGMHYSLVLQTQVQMISEIHNLLENELKLIEEVAKWEQEAVAMQG